MLLRLEPSQPFKGSGLASKHFTYGHSQLFCLNETCYEVEA